MAFEPIANASAQLRVRGKNYETYLSKSHAMASDV